MSEKSAKTTFRSNPKTTFRSNPKTTFRSTAKSTFRPNGPSSERAPERPSSPRGRTRLLRRWSVADLIAQAAARPPATPVST